MHKYSNNDYYKQAVSNSEREHEKQQRPSSGKPQQREKLFDAGTPP